MRGLIDIKNLVFISSLLISFQLSAQAEIEIEITPASCDTCCDGSIRILSAVTCVSGSKMTNWWLDDVKMSGTEASGLCNELHKLHHKSDELIGSVSFYLDGTSVREETHKYKCKFEPEAFFRSDLSITGFFKHHFESDTIEGNVQVFQNNELVQSIVVNESGYAFKLPISGEYELWYIKEGFFTKKLLIDTDGPHGMDKWRGYRLHIDMRMIPMREGLSLSLLDQPISKASYDEKADNYTWDTNRAYKVKQVIDKKTAPFFETPE